jgi:hypothetical protein
VLAATANIKAAAKYNSKVSIWSSNVKQQEEPRTNVKCKTTRRGLILNVKQQ